MSKSIIYTYSDEAPALATRSFLPILRAFLGRFGLQIEELDISLAARAKEPKLLAKLAALVEQADLKLVKTPNISASAPQLAACAKELKEANLPLPEDMSKALGSAVNPVIRQGNALRSVPNSVKKNAQKNPYKVAKDIDLNSYVASMREGDFYGSEQGFIASKTGKASLRFKSLGEDELLKELDLGQGDVVDASLMSISSLQDFYEKEFARAKAKGVLLSLHLKTSMMKKSDPYIFGIALKTYFSGFFKDFEAQIKELKIDASEGLGALLQKIKGHKDEAAMQSAIDRALDEGAKLYHPSAARSNFHVSSDVIIDASMPFMLKNGARLTGSDMQFKSAAALIPDRAYAGIYEETLAFLQTYGVLDPKTLGSLVNVGLMAKSAQEYGSHSNTFIAPKDGVFELCLASHCLRHEAKEGDIYRINIARKEAIEDWIKLGLSEAAKPIYECAIFWIDEKRPGNELLRGFIKDALAKAGLSEGKAFIMSPKEATRKSWVLLKEGKRVLSITGNVLRDYLTDLFPILELGSSSRMLSVTPLLKGGVIYETGAGGTAPRQMAQFMDCSHLRWDSLGEFLAMQALMEHMNESTLAQAFDEAILDYLNEGKSPGPSEDDLDSSSSHFYFALYLAKSLAKKDEFFKGIYEELSSKEAEILAQFRAAKGRRAELGGYYLLDFKKTEAAMRPSAIFNKIIEKINAQARIKL